LNSYQDSTQEKQPPSWSSSIRQVESEVNDNLKAFQSHVEEVKDISLRLEELTKMLKSGEIPENVYELIMNELGEQLSISIEEIFRLREILEIAKVKAKLEWAREKIKLKDLSTSSSKLPEPPKMILQEGIYTRRDVYLPLYRWQEIVNRIDEALSSLTIDEELSLIEKYLTLIKEKEKVSPSTGSKEIERAKEICKQRLKAISEKWSSIRRSKIERIMNLELKSSQLRDEIKEIEVRFAVGEIDENVYEYRISTARASARKIEKEISDIRNYIDDMDMKIFRSSELLRED